MFHGPGIFWHDPTSAFLRLTIEKLSFTGKESVCPERNMQLLLVVLIFALLLQVSFAFTGSRGNRLIHCARKTTTIKASLLDNVVQYKDIFSNKASFLLAEIDYEALEALGNISPDEASSAATGVTPIAGTFTNDFCITQAFFTLHSL